MLAQNLKTPSALGISEEEYAALARVLAMLERGELKHATGESREVGDRFCMSSYGGLEECGTAGCIAGWARLIGDDKVFRWANDANEMFSPDNLQEELYNLFHPDQGSLSWHKITPDQAAIALRNYLTHGEPRWAEALSS